MMSGKCCEVTGRAFDDKDAARDIREYRRFGPAGQTAQLLKSVRELGLVDATLLDIGGGVGVIHHELLGDIARQATHVDASAAYLEAAREESARRGHAQRIRFIHADFTEIARELPQADVVTLDRVVCCYPDFRVLLRAAADRSRRILALTYPRQTWYLRIGLDVVNFFQRLRRDPFRVFLHPVKEMERLLNQEGLRQISLKRLFVWEVALYAREA
jgi:magnesium-protoporphyrin O-methyltransferase